MAHVKHLTATANNLVTGPGNLYGYIVSSHSSGTLKAWDNVVASGSEYLHDTWTLAAGPQVIMFPEPIQFRDALSITVGGTVNVEVITD